MNIHHFCSCSFQIPICSECCLRDHHQPDHQCEKLSEIEARQVEELRSLVTEGRSKLEKCRLASEALESALSDLQEQTDNAKGLIIETFQSYKALLEKRKV